MAQAGPTEGSRNSFNDMYATIQDLRTKNTELKEVVSYFKKENLYYKQKYNELKERLIIIMEVLQKNASVVNQLFSETVNALQAGQIAMLDSISLPKQTLRIGDLKTTSERVVSPLVRCRHLNFQNVNEPLEQCEISIIEENSIVNKVSENKTSHKVLRNLRSGIEVEENLNSQHNGTQCDKLLTVEEENLTLTKEIQIMLTRLPLDTVNEHEEENLTRTKEVQIMLTRLPLDTVNEHLRKNHILSKSDESSTKHLLAKTRFARRLGLLPTKQLLKKNSLEPKKRKPSEKQKENVSLKKKKIKKVPSHKNKSNSSTQKLSSAVKISVSSKKKALTKKSSSTKCLPFTRKVASKNRRQACTGEPLNKKKRRN